MLKEWTLKDLKKEYNLNIEEIAKKIKIKNAKRVLLQFPEGLKQYSTSITDYLEKKTNSEFFIWMGNCFGACDTPQGLDNMNIDLIIQIGHNSLMPSY
jgi:2-(3-amino-3-carboxypropyl)histidine synthase